MHPRFLILTTGLIGLTMTTPNGLALPILLTNDTTIAEGHTAFEGGDLVVQGCVLNIAGDHGFNGVEVRAAGMVIFTGTNLTAKTVSMREASTMKLAGGSTLEVIGTLTVLDRSTVIGQGKNTTNQLAGAWAGAGVFIKANDVTVDPTSRIESNGQGYTCPGAGQSGNGPGGGRRGWWGGPNASGGGHGGDGGSGSRGSFASEPGLSCGSATTPLDLGSAGGGVDGIGGAGGGAVRLVAVDTLTLDGVISANGNPSSGWGAGGAGGSIWIDAGRLTGTGSVQAHGGVGEGSGGGGGGRVAIYSATNQFTGVANCEVQGGAGSYPGQPGTLAFFDTSQPQPHLWVYHRFAFESNTSHSYGAITVAEGGQLLLGNEAQLEVTGTFIVTNGSTLTLGGGSLLKVGGALDILSNSVVICQGLNTTGQVNHAWVGTGVAIEAGSVMVNVSSHITADGQGYTCPGINKTGNGPGGGRMGWWGGPYASGAGYGGAGGVGDKWAYKNPAGALYGSMVYPLDLGSAGGGSDNVGGSGGGAVQLTVRETLNLDGSIRANGNVCKGDGAGGAGGSILISARSLAGLGFISADGGEGLHASGGGGRIALYYWENFGLVASNVTARGGIGRQPGQNGTVRLSNTPEFVWLQPAGLCHGVQPLAWTVLAVNPFELTAEIHATHAGREHVLGSSLGAMGKTNWDTTSFPDGVYELRISFGDPQLQLIGEAVQPVLVNNSIKWHSGYLESNEVWTAGTVHAVEGILTVGAGVTLTLEPGAVVKNAAGARWIIESGAVVDALGTNGADVVFTSLSDDLRGGDSNLDGSQSGPRPGDWAMTGATAATFQVNGFTEIRYGIMLHNGSVNQDEVWPGTMLHRITEDLTFGNGATVTIEPGAIIKFDAMRNLTVGTGSRLSAVGSRSQPITFTSIKDDAAGGDTNEDGDQTQPGPGDWQMIVIDGAQAAFDHVLITYGAGTPDGQYAATGVLRGCGAASVTVSNSVIRSTLFEGVRWDGADLTMVNTVIAQTDRAVNPTSGTMRLIHCTLEDNRVGIFMHGGRIEVINTIISHSVQVGVDGLQAPSFLRYCNVWSPTGMNYTGTDLTGQSGNISADPKFGDRDSGNYRLSFRSPCIDAADGATSSSTDQKGAPRYDDPRTANSGTAMTNGAFADMGAFEFVETAISDVDLIVTLVSGPNEATAGGTATVRWIAANRGTGRAIGPWHDAIEFVPQNGNAASVLPVVEVLCGQGLTLGPGEVASFSTQVRVPGGTEGRWRWQVRANCRAEVFEGLLLDNNTTVAVADTELRIPSLTVGSVTNSMFVASAVPAWFKLEQRAGQELTVTLDAATQQGRCRLFTGVEQMPSEVSFDLRSAAWNSPDARLALPATDRDRTVYLLVMPVEINDGKLAYTMTVQVSQFLFDRIGLASAGNAGPVTIPLFGGGFESGLSAQLRLAAGSNILARSIALTDSTGAQATFDLKGAPIGFYSVVVAQEGRELALTNAFAVQRGAGGELWTRLVLPTAARQERPFTAYLEYGNSGDADLDAPLLHVSGAGLSLLMWNAERPEEHGNGLTLLAVALDGPHPGVLRPGSSYSIPIRMEMHESGTANFGVYPIPCDEQPPNYAYVESIVVSPQAEPIWQSAWQKVMRDMGLTRTGYVRALTGAASRARQFQLNLITEMALVRFLIEEAEQEVQSAPVAGQLFLADTNHPLGHKQIQLSRKDKSSEDTYAVLTGVTWYDGRFGISGVTAGTYLLSVESYLPETVMEIQLTDPLAEPLTNLTVVVVSPAGQVSGRVTAGVTATPVAGALVVARLEHSPTSYPGVTSANGDYVINGLPPGNYVLELMAPGYLPQVLRPFTLATGEQIVESYSLSLSGGKISGKVLRPDGQVVPEAAVTARWEKNSDLYGSWTGSDDVSSKAGTFQLNGLLPGTYRVAASADGVGVSIATNVVITDVNSQVSLDLVLRLGATVQGVVVDSATRQPVVGASLSVRAIPDIAIDTQTDSAGKFVLTGLGMDQYFVTVLSDHHLPVRVQVQVQEFGTQSLTIELGHLGIVHGYVRSRGALLRGIPITVQSTNGLGIQTKTDVQGHFEVGNLPPGAYRVAVGPEVGPHLWGEDFVISAANESNITRDFVLDTLSSMSGHAYQANGAAIQTNATVFLVNNGELIVQTKTDARGWYGFHILEPGVFDLYALGEAGWFTPLSGIVVTNNQHLSDLDIMTSPNELHVTVTSQASGQPINQAVVRVEPVVGPVGVLSLKAQTTNDGTCLLAPLPQALYRVGASAEGYAYTEQTIAVDREHTSVALALPSGKTLQGTVTANGIPAAGVLVQVARTNRGLLFTTETDTQGHYRFTALPGGAFVLAVLPGMDYVPILRDAVLTDLVEDSKVDVDLSSTGGG